MLASIFIAMITRSQLVQDWSVPISKAQAIAVDSSGNCYLTGTKDVMVNGSVRQDACLQKYDSHGNFIWERTVDNGHDDYGVWVGLDRNGDIYNAGRLGEAGYFGNTGGLAYMEKVYAQKYSPDGILLWRKTYGGVTTDCRYGNACLDKYGNLFIAAQEYVDLYDCRDTIPGSGQNLGESVPGGYGVVLKYSPDGLEAVMKYYGRGEDRVGPTQDLICADDMGGVYARWGITLKCPADNPSSWFSGTTLVHHGQTGAVLWQQIWEISDPVYENPAGLDGNGNFYTFKGYGNSTLCKYSSLHSLVWEAPFENGTGQGSIREDGEGNVYATSGSVLVKLNSLGQQLWRAQVPWGSGASPAIAFDRFGLIHTDIGCYDANGNRQWSGGGSNVDANGCSYLVNSDANNNYYLYKYLGGKIHAPQKGDLWISGEKDTIRWGASLGDASLDIEYSEDGGATYTPVASGIRADSLQYVWDIPAKTAPKTKSKVKLKKAQQEITFAVSDIFGVKPLMITRKETSNDSLVSYDYNKDRWGFSNTEEDVWPYLYWYSRFSYNGGMDPFTGQPFPSWEAGLPFRKANDSDYPDWPSFVRAFTVDACYISLSQAIYSQRAAARWWSARHPWGGSCFGIAGTNALAFSKRDAITSRIPMLSILYNPISVQSDTNVVSTVTEIFTHQFGNPSMSNDISGKQKTANQTLKDLKAMLRQEVTPLATLTLGTKGPGGSGYHTILAYWVEPASDDSPVWNVHVYDNSYPNEVDPIIEIDTSQNYGDGSWKPMYGWAGSGGRDGIWLEVPSENYLSPATLPKRDVRQSPFDVSPGLLEIGGVRGASIKIRDGSGNVTGYSGGQVWSDIPGSTPLFVKNGSLAPPYGYMLNAGTYSIAVDSFKTSEPDIYFFTPSRTLGYWRSGADSLQRDNLQFDTTGGPSLRVANPDAQAKSIVLKAILSEAGLEKIYSVSGLGLAGNDSATMGSWGTDGLRVVSHGAAKDYTIRVEHASAGGLRIFSKTNVPLGANTTHMITPGWETLGGNLAVFVDVGNDGTVDDTLTLKNDLTGADDHGSLIPGEYRLYQNFPNPFNPVTTIRYGLPQKSAVTLTVYNLLGQEVATLVTMEEEAGYHEVRFDGSGLASGVYIYRLQAGDFVQSRKLILLR